MARDTGLGPIFRPGAIDLLILMPLFVGTRLGTYEILAAVGAVCKGEDVQKSTTRSTGGLSSAVTMTIEEAMSLGEREDQ